MVTRAILLVWLLLKLLKILLIILIEAVLVLRHLNLRINVKNLVSQRILVHGIRLGRTTQGSGLRKLMC
jgi:hypothetical protein